MSLPQRVECAMVYIKQLKERVEELKRRKVQLQGPITSVQQPQGPGINNEIITPVLQITDSESTVEVYLIAEAGTRTRFVVRDIITILEEEGAEVLSVNYHTMGNMTLVSVYSQAAYSRIGIENCRVHERLRRLQISLKQIP